MSARVTGASGSRRVRSPHQQYDDHHDEDQRVVDLRIKHRADRLQQAEREAGEDRTADRPEPADDDDRERVDDDLIAHRRLDVLVRRRQHAGERRERHAAAEHDRDQPLRVDASARTSTGASVAARMRAPIGVRSSMSQTATETSAAVTITKSL